MPEAERDAAQIEYDKHKVDCPICSRAGSVEAMCPEGQRLHAAQFDGDEV